MSSWMKGVGWSVLLYAFAGCTAGMSPFTQEQDDSEIETGLAETDVDDTDDDSDVDPDETDAPDETDVPEEETLSAFELCFEEIRGDGTHTGPDYDQYTPTIGSHCHGTNHQDIRVLSELYFWGIP